jgi:hypothetical protein
MVNFSRFGRLVSGGLVVLLAELGCSQTPIRKAFSIVTAQDTVRLRQSAENASFTVSVVIKNSGNQALLVDRCGPSAERRTNNLWEPVFFPTCVSVKQMSELSAGESLVLPAFVYGPADLHQGDVTKRSLTPGVYRLVFQLMYRSSAGTSRSIPASQSTSEPFLVVASNPSD